MSDAIHWRPTDVMILVLLWSNLSRQFLVSQKMAVSLLSLLANAEEIGIGNVESASDLGQV